VSFASDNIAGASPEIIAAISAANAGRQPSYGADGISTRLTQLMCDLFEREVAIFPVVSGTAANALALSCLVPPWGVVFCHADAHIEVDECAAPELITGGAKLAALPGAHGKIQPETILARLGQYRRGDQHQPQPAAISITQSSEWGTVYSKREVEAFGELARSQNLALHMDGARFANALVSTNAAPADITWRAGVDILSFGATKNGAMMAEAIVVFDPKKAETLPFRRKRAGHLISKMRFVSAQLEAYLSGGLMMRNAAHANAMAKRLADGLCALPGAELACPVEANGVFIHLPSPMAQGLADRGHVFYPWGALAGRPDAIVYRLVTAFDTPAELVDDFIGDAKACVVGEASV
jgi:threonine aldolase